MGRKRTNPPRPSREKGQRSIDDPLYLARIAYPFPFTQPEQIKGTMWRNVVAAQPVCVDCREFLISSILSLEWKIEPRDTDQRDELKEEINYYTDLINQHNEYDYTHIIEWIGRDMLDLPFGGIMELGREGNRPDGRVLWYELLDGATCFPTLNNDWPIGQQYADQVVYFPTHSVNRIYCSPRTEIIKRGWGQPPPEKIYLALELINRGDRYYAKLLLDTPPVGILDLLDMDKESAEEWIKAWRTLMGGADPYKIPVLYEHEKPAAFVDFTRSPTEIMFDKAHNLYATLVASGYGISLSDIGIGGGGGGGETLSGTIRDERRTRRTGFARMKRKFKLFFDRMLPKELEFKFVDLDEETSVALGRARLASSTAMQAWINAKMFSPQEARLQTIADGLWSTSVPEKVPDESEFPQPEFGNAERPSMLGRPVSPSSGGYGETSARSEIDKKIETFFSLDDTQLRRMMYQLHPLMAEEVRGAKETLGDELLGVWAEWYDDFIWGDIGELPFPDIDLTVQDLAVQQIINELLLPEMDEQFMSTAIDFVKNTVENLFYEENRARVIKGESKISIQWEIPNGDILDMLEKEINKIPLEMSRAIVSATRKFLLSETNLKDPERLVYGDNIASVANGEISKAHAAVVKRVAENLSNIINDIVKGVENGSTKETEV